MSYLYLVQAIKLLIYTFKMERVRTISPVVKSLVSLLLRMLLKAGTVTVNKWSVVLSTKN